MAEEKESSTTWRAQSGCRPRKAQLLRPWPVWRRLRPVKPREQRLTPSIIWNWFT